MHTRMPSTLYTIVDTPVRAEGRRISGPPAAGPVLVCCRSDSCSPGFTSMYTQMLCHMRCGSLGLACRRAQACKALCPRRLEKTSGLAQALVHGAPCPCSSGWRRSLTTGVRLWTPRRAALRQWGLVARRSLVSMQRACCSPTTPRRVLSSRVMRAVARTRDMAPGRKALSRRCRVVATVAFSDLCS